MKAWMKSLPLHMSMMVLIIGCVAAGEVYLSHVRVNVSQAVAMRKVEKSDVQQEVQNLKLEIASITRPDTLRRLAREKLGMHSPTPMQVFKP